MIRPCTALAALTFVGACAPADMATRAEMQAVAVEHAPDGSCFAREVTPAVYEQVPGQVQVVQAEYTSDGTMTRPPIYRNASVPRIVRPRGEIRFAAPCPAQMTPEVISSLQRALAARGYFNGTATGRMDATTVDAVRRFQTDRGLKSAHLSLETTRTLGLIAVETNVP
ncbi:putative peptidoglycan binding protein [Puniceibacterium sp. IMCC21224]|nr:putative peptidoglycan binding protein [Puniceibacterium sp. IMCC21224]